MLKVSLALFFQLAGFPIGGKLVKRGVVSLLGRAGLKGPNVPKYVPQGLTTLVVEVALKPLYSA
jgi:hypothetical protein